MILLGSIFYELRSQAVQGAFDHGVAPTVSFAAELIDEADQHDSVEDGDTAQRDEPDAGADGEGHVAQPECEHSSGHGQRHAHENERGLTQAAKAHVDQD